MSRQPALKAALLLAFGIYLDHLLTPSWKWVYSAGWFSFAVLMIVRPQKNGSWIRTLFAVSLLISVGMFRHAAVSRSLPGRHIVHGLPGFTEATFKVRLVTDPVERKNRSDWIAEVLHITMEDTSFPVCGRVLCIIPFSKTGLVYGDCIGIRGVLEEPKGKRNPGGFDYRSYLARRSIHRILRMDSRSRIVVLDSGHGSWLFRRFVYPARRFILRVARETTDGQNRALLESLLIGEKRGLEEDIKDDFSKAGVIHILAVSGLHVGYIFLILTSASGILRIPFLLKNLIVLAGLGLYMLITESSPPVVRAVLMAAVHILGPMLQRKPDLLNTIGVSAVFLLALRPEDLFDPGFQLSYAAVLSMAWFEREFGKKPLPNFLKRIVRRIPGGRALVSLTRASSAAWLGTLPLTICHYNQIPLLSLISNWIAIPISGWITALGFVTVMVFGVSPALASGFAALNHELLTLIRKAMAWIGSCPFSHLHTASPDFFVYALFIILGIGLLFWKEKTVRKAVVLSGLILFNVKIWTGALSETEFCLTWIQFDVGQGDAALIRFPRGQNLLIDGGVRNPSFDTGSRILAPSLHSLGIRKLDTVILTHPHDDHAGGLISVIKEFRIGRVIAPSVPCESELYRLFLETVSVRKIPLIRFSAEDSVLVFTGAKVRLFWPFAGREHKDKEDLNDASIVINIVFGKTSILLMGDSGVENENLLMNHCPGLRCDILKAGHHGSSTSSSLNFLKRIDPEEVVISVGEHNRFRHPSKFVLARLKDLGIPIRRTDLEGALAYESDGDKVKEVGFR